MGMETTTIPQNISTLDGIDDVDAITEAQGQILIRNATKWTALDPSTSGKFLQTKGAGADPSWEDPAKKWDVISEQTISGSNADYVDFTGLDIDSDKVYKLFATVKNANATDSNYRVEINSDTTNTNYTVQRTFANGSSIATARLNDNQIASGGVSQNNVGLIEITIMHGIDEYARVDGKMSSLTSGVYRTNFSLVKSSATITNITSFRLTATQTGGVAIGSHFVLVKLRG